MSNTLNIKNLTVTVEDRAIVHSLDLAIKQGSMHVIMGPNGSGKSSLAFALMGHPTYQVAGGTIQLNKECIQELPIHKRAQAGLFLSFQHPQDLPGVPLRTFLKAAYESMHEHITPQEIQTKVFELFDLLELDHELYFRTMQGFSGGQKKKIELVQMLLLNPKVAILDEIDSGLDVDALHVVAGALRLFLKNNPESSLVIITHYQRLLHHLTADHVHIMYDGKLVMSGDASLAEQVETHGYEYVHR